MKQKVSKAILIFSFIATSYAINAQNKLKGTVLSNNKEPMINSNILLYNAKDSILVKGVITNLNGNFSLENIAIGQYFITASYTGYVDFTRQLEITNSISDLGTIVLTEDASQLNQVTVIGKKPFFEQKIDRMVINVKNSITNAGSNVLEILQKSPGIIVNKQAGSINMSGKDGVQVMLNGKMTYMPANAIIAMLEGMGSNNVEKIELITTPPSRFDAGGNAGYINIVLSKTADEGFNGSYSLTAAAFNGTAPAATFDFNYRKKAINFYGGYSFSRLAQLQYISSNRQIFQETKTTETNINSRRVPSQLNHGLRLGFDYQLTKRTTLGVLASGYNNKWSMEANNTSTTAINSTDNMQIAIKNDETNQWKHGMINFNIQHILKSGAELNLNVDYLRYDNYNPTQYVNSYLFGSQIGTIDNLKSSKKTIIDLLPIQLDFSKKLGEKTSFEMGAKTVFSKFNNNVLVEKLTGNIWNPDQEFTANYHLKEQIAAAYSSVTINASAKNTLKAGLRYEYTMSNLGSEKEANIVDRKYGYFFPTTYFSHKFNENNNINFSFNKRINRPTFNNLAPFLIFTDPNTFISGNAALQPALAKNFGVNYTLKRVNFSINYTHEDFTIGGFQLKIDKENNKQYNTAENLKYTKTLNSTITIPTKISNWWNSQISLNSSWNHAVADYLTPAVSIKLFTYNLSGFQSFTLSKNLSMELSGFYQSKGLYGISVMKAYGMVNFGTQIKFPKSNSNLKFGVNDIFSTMKFNFENNSDVLGYQAAMNLNMQRRIFKVTFSQNFGNNLLKSKRNRGTASDAERQRVSN